MKNLLIVFILGAVMFYAFGSRKSDAQLLSEANVAINAGCKKSAQDLPNASPAQIDRFCSCSTDKVLATLGIEGVRKLSGNALTADEEAKSMQAALACKDMLTAP